MWSSKPKRTRARGDFSSWLLAVGWVGICVGLVGAVTQSQAQQLLPPDRTEIADQERLSWTLQKFPPQPYMNEVYWQYSKETPAFFRDSLLQFVARTYYLTRDNFDGSKSQAWAGGGWLAFRSGLIGDVFGVHLAGYTSQPIFAPADEGGTKLLAPPQNSIGVLGQAYGRVQLGDQEIRGGRQLVDTPLINPQDNRMVPNTFEGCHGGFAAGQGSKLRLLRRLSLDYKTARLERLHPDVGCADRQRRHQPWRGLRDDQVPAGLGAFACRYGLQCRGRRQHGLRPSRIRFQADRREFQTGSSARTSSGNKASEPICSPALPSRPIKLLRKDR